MIPQYEESIMSKDKMVWVVGDDPAVMMKVVGNLKDKHELRVFGNADDAASELRVVTNNKPDLVIADHDTKNIMSQSGIVRKADRNNIPVILLSNTPEIEEKLAMKNVTVTSKELSSKELTDLVDESIAAHAGMQYARK